MPVIMHTAIPCTGSTADQADSTVHVQLGAAKHLTRPLTLKWRNFFVITDFFKYNGFFFYYNGFICYNGFITDFLDFTGFRHF